MRSGEQRGEVAYPRLHSCTRDWVWDQRGPGQAKPHHPRQLMQFSHSAMRLSSVPLYIKLLASKPELGMASRILDVTLERTTQICNWVDCCAHPDSKISLAWFGSAYFSAFTVLFKTENLRGNASRSKSGLIFHVPLTCVFQQSAYKPMYEHYGGNRNKQKQSGWSC